MGRKFQRVTGFVLAGGASRRMGRDKTKLELGGQTLLERQLRLVAAVCRRIVVLGPETNSSSLKTTAIPDVAPGRGPLGAIYTGLLRTRTEYNLVLGCDLPLMEEGLLRYLCRRALVCSADVTVPESRSHGYETLCAVYRRRALPAIRKILESGEYKVSRFFPDVHCRVVLWRELAGAGFRPEVFANMNTPRDYEAARRKLSLVSSPFSVVEC